MSTPGAIILGSRMRSIESRQQKNTGGEMFYHNVESWQEMWQIVSEDTGVRWQVSFSR